MRTYWYSLEAMKEDLRPEINFRSRNESKGGRGRKRGKDRGQRKGKWLSRRDRENQRAFSVPPNSQMRYEPGPRISMQASGNHQCAVSNRPDTRKQSAWPDALIWTRKNPCAGDAHTRRRCQ